MSLRKDLAHQPTSILKGKAKDSFSYPNLTEKPAPDIGSLIQLLVQKHKSSG
jgi:hypothetical protein